MCSRTKLITVTAVFTAMCSALNIFSLPLGPDIMVTFTYLIVVMAGVLCGPICGFLTGFLGDVVGCIIHPLGAYLPSLSISLGLWGVFGWAVFRLLRKLPFYVNMLIIFILGLIVCSVGINCTTFFFAYSKETNYLVYVLGRIVSQSTVAGINCALCIAVYPILKPIYSRFITN